jgi:ABC-type dipeptide/oligopeptide/nickel transport system ATPase component
MHAVLFEEEGFAGNLDRYYNALNSYLPAALNTRHGVPILLSLIYKVVGQWAGLTVKGINAPGHFMVRVRCDNAWMIVDPFFGGQMLTRDEAFDRLVLEQGELYRVLWTKLDVREQSVLRAFAADPDVQITAAETARRFGLGPKSSVHNAVERLVQAEHLARLKGGQYGFDDPFFRHFFGDRGFRGRGQSERVQNSLGSGVIVREDGYIATNYHVIQQTEEIEVRLADGRFYEAEVVGTDRDSDLAVIRIDANDLSTVSLGSMENVRVGRQRELGTSFPFWRSESSLETLNDRARELIEAVGLAGFEDELAVELPYGRKRALEIATTLALDPEMMLLDEPTSGMAAEDVDRITSLIKRVAANRTVLMVEHNLSVVSSLSDRITVLARGQVLAEGNYEDVSSDPRVVEAYIGTGHA